MIAVVGTLAWEFQVSLPLMATHVFGGGAAAYGVMASVMGAGAVVGGLISAARPRPRTRALCVAASCSTVLAIELNVIEPYPTNSIAASSSGSDGATAASRMAIPQPIAARQSARPLGRALAAETSPPTTAPAPITDAITP